MPIDRTHEFLTSRYYYHNACRFLLARWCIEIPDPYYKVCLARHVYAHSKVLADAIQRLGELSLPIPDWPSEAGVLSEISAESILEPASPKLVNGFYKSNLADQIVKIGCCYQKFDTIADEPTFRLGGRIAEELGRHMEEFRRCEAQGNRDWLAVSANAGSSLVSELFRVIDKPARSTKGVTTPAGSIKPSPEVDYAIQLIQANIFDLEIATIESCCRLILGFQCMPEEFRQDMARQCWDESRHAALFIRVLAALGGELAPGNPCNLLWEMASGQPIEVMLALHQRIGEWIGVDGALFHAKLFRTDIPSLSQAFDFIARDEITHVAFGNKWIRHLVSDQALAGVDSRANQIRKSFGKRDGGPLTFPFNRWACEAANFSSAEIVLFENRFKELGSLLSSAI